MRKNGIKKALTSDHHFIQAGFEKLLDIEKNKQHPSGELLGG
jgi:hypothetical protein